MTSFTASGGGSCRASSGTCSRSSCGSSWFPRDSLLDMGLRTRGFFKHAWIYGLFLVDRRPALLIVSREARLRLVLPVLQGCSRSWFDFLSWEAMYFAQFFALEMFFRGFWLGALRRSFGSGAIFAMAVPYCMIHFGKPFLEKNIYTTYKNQKLKNAALEAAYATAISAPAPSEEIPYPETREQQINYALGIVSQFKRNVDNDAPNPMLINILRFLPLVENEEEAKKCATIAGALAKKKESIAKVESDKSMKINISDLAPTERQKRKQQDSSLQDAKRMKVARPEVLPEAGKPPIQYAPQDENLFNTPANPLQARNKNIEVENSQKRKHEKQGGVSKRHKI